MNWRDFVKEAERVYWLGLIARADGNIAEVARLADINRTHCYARMRKCDIDLKKVERNRKTYGGNEAWRSLNS